MDISYSNKIVELVAQHVREEMEGLCIAHDFFHIQRVVRLAQIIHKEEGAGDIQIIELGALLHESFDDKFFAVEELPTRKAKLAQQLQQRGLSEFELEQVLFIADNVGYGKSLERGEDFVATKEFEIVEDADRLEGLGAIAIARIFSYGGANNSPMYDPAIQPKILLDRKMYKAQSATSINYFYEALLLLKDSMHTTTGARFAQQRHEFVLSYLDQFFKERDCIMD